MRTEGDGARNSRVLVENAGRKPTEDPRHLERGDCLSCFSGELTSLPLTGLPLKSPNGAKIKYRPIPVFIAQQPR